MSEGTTQEPQGRHIWAAVIAVMDAVTNVPKSGEMKNKKGDHQYYFVRSADLVSKVGAEFRSQGVMVQSRDLEVTLHQAPVSGERGSTIWTTSSVRLVYQFTSLVDGSTLEFASAGEGRDSSDKATAKAMTMAFKSALSQAFAIATDEKDPDADQPVAYQSDEHRPPEPDTRTPQQRAAQEAYEARRRQGTAPPGTEQPRGTRQSQPADPDPVGAATALLQQEMGAAPVNTATNGNTADPAVLDQLAGQILAKAATQGGQGRPRDTAQQERCQAAVAAAQGTGDRTRINKIVLKANEEGLLNLQVGDMVVGQLLSAARGTAVL